LSAATVSAKPSDLAQARNSLWLISGLLTNMCQSILGMKVARNSSGQDRVSQQSGFIDPGEDHAFRPLKRHQDAGAGEIFSLSGERWLCPLSPSAPRELGKQEQVLPLRWIKKERQDDRLYRNRPLRHRKSND
jgi:hypothetical protein